MNQDSKGEESVNGLTARLRESVRPGEEVTQELKPRWERIKGALDTAIDSIETLLRDGQVDPWYKVVTLGQDADRTEDANLAWTAFDQAGDAVPNIGILPLHANPIHWSHIHMGLQCIAALKLSCAIYLPQGDPCKEVKAADSHDPADLHEIVRDVLDDWHPLLRYTDVGLGNCRPGEWNLHRLLRWNRRRTMNVYCIWGFKEESRCRGIARKLRFATDELGPAADRHRLNLVLTPESGCDPVVCQEAIQDWCEQEGLPRTWSVRFLKDVEDLGIHSTEYREHRDGILVPPVVHERYPTLPKRHAAP